MKVKTSELTGVALDWAVAKCEEVQIDICAMPEMVELLRMPLGSGRWRPSRDWAQGGPIIEQERIWVQPEIGKEGSGNAWYAVSMHSTDAYGPTPLIAAMRCFVSSRLGDEVEIPDELMQGE